MLHAPNESIGYRLRRALIIAMRMLHDRGLVNLRGGNASALLLLEDGSAFIYITPAGKPKAMLEPEDVSVLDIDGHVYSGKPSSEYRMHLAIYRKRRDVRAVVHAHNPLAVLAAKLKLDLGANMLGVEQRYYIGSCIPHVPYAEPGTEDIAEAAAEALSSCNVALLEDHGAVALGTSPDPVEAVYEAVDRLEVLEDVARAALLSALLHARR
ncbi:MAG: class II aldolase/adducin family protein [Thermoproteota archaeon]